MKKGTKGYKNVQKRTKYICLLLKFGSQKDEIVKRMNWGGKREGAGRPKSATPKILWSVKVTPEEKEYLKQMLKEYRSK